MNNETVIAIENISKIYKLYNSPLDRLKEAAHPFGKKYHHDFYALRDVNMEIRRGETIGIAGCNGSGKSTLLKIITGVLSPTAGSIVVNGNVSALLELGAGFNPELTGVENIYFNGTLNGFSKQETDKHLDDILAFADIGEFVFQPVKVYSSGMFVRLAFATAINVNPDILIVDEALAVGDAKFQHKCFNKFKNFQDDGKTILFVTHDMNSITRYCSKAVLLNDGSVVDIGEPIDITRLYVDLLFTGGIEGYSLCPKLLEENYQGFNIVHFKKRYFGVSISLGDIDISQIAEQKLSEYIKEKKCILGTSPEEVRQFINDMNISKNDFTADSGQETQIERNKTGLDIFLEGVSEGDNCINRKSYNNNEHRISNKKASILDYFITVDEKEEASYVLSGSKIHLYLKTIFYDDIPYPNYGFAIKALDGVLVYGTHTSLLNQSIPSIDKRHISIVKFTFTLPLNKGDYFFDVGVGNTCNEVLDWRGDLIHIVVHVLPSYTYTGLVDCKTTFIGVTEKVKHG